MVDTFIEVPFMLGDKRVYPDGLIRVSRGSRSWTCLVEVKTASNQLEAGQLESYLEVARTEGFDALLTISNEIPAMAGTHPTSVDKRKLRKVAIHHLSWTQVLTEAVMQKVHRGVADPDQAWILGELIRYLEHPRSGALEFEDMGASWVAVREAVAAGTLRSSDKTAAEVAARWDQLIRYACLRLGRQLGIEVQPTLSRRELAEPGLRAQVLVDSLTTHGDASRRLFRSARTRSLYLGIAPRCPCQSRPTRLGPEARVANISPYRRRGHGHEAWSSKGKLRGRGAGVARRLLRIDGTEHQAMGCRAAKAPIAATPSGDRAGCSRTDRLDILVVSGRGGDDRTRGSNEPCDLDRSRPDIPPPRIDPSRAIPEHTIPDFMRIRPPMGSRTRLAKTKDITMPETCRFSVECHWPRAITGRSARAGTERPGPTHSRDPFVRTAQDPGLVVSACACPYSRCPTLSDVRSSARIGGRPSVIGLSTAAEI